MINLIRNLWPNPFYCKKLKAPFTIASHSHYLEELKKEGLRGNSRIWGDATIETQHTAIVLTTAILRANKFREEDIAFALCLLRVESGFNPDAAAGSSSASGLGQFTDRTREVLAERIGIDGKVATSNKFDAVLNILLLVPQLKECFDYARKAVGVNKYVAAYEYHHDGPSGGSGGAEIAQREVLPRLQLAKEFLK